MAGPSTMINEAPLYPLAVSTWGEEEPRAAIAVIESGYTTMGPKVAAFEAAAAERFGVRHAVMVNSGSSANLLAVAALFFTDKPLARPGQVAVVPAVSWATTYFPLTQYGLKLRFVDINPETLNFDLEALEAALTDDVAVVFAVDLLGNPNDYDAIAKMLAGRPITLLEDTCEFMGARFGGRQAGSFGRIGTFSSFFSHHIATMEGGLCVTDDEELHHILLSLRSHGWTRHLPNPNRLVDRDPRGAFYDQFRFILPGYNVRPLEVSGAIGLEQLKKLPDLVARRRANAEIFRAAFKDLKGVRLQREIGESSWFSFAFTLTGEAKVTRDQLVARLARAGVDTRPVAAGNFSKAEVIKHMPHEPPPPLVNAEVLDSRGFFIGNSHVDLAPKVARLRQVFEEAMTP